MIFIFIVIILFPFSMEIYNKSMISILLNGEILIAEQMISSDLL